MDCKRGKEETRDYCIRLDEASQEGMIIIKNEGVREEHMRISYNVIIPLNNIYVHNNWAIVIVIVGWFVVDFVLVVGI